MSGDIRKQILGQPSQDPLAVIENLLNQAQAQINAAMTILVQTRQLKQAQAAGELPGECPHPPKEIKDTSTMGVTERICGMCGTVLFRQEESDGAS